MKRYEYNITNEEVIMTVKLWGVDRLHLLFDYHSEYNSYQLFDQDLVYFFIFIFIETYPHSKIIKHSTLSSWILSHWQVLQGGLGRGGIQRTSIGHWGSPGLGSWTPPLLHIHYITGSHHTGTWFLLPSAWMKEHHLQLNLAKTELLVLPATPTLQ